METQVIKEKKGLKDIFVCKQFMIMIIGNLISRFGDSVDAVAFGWMVYELTGSKLLMGTLFAVNAIPNIVFSVFSGVIVDYLPKKTVIVLGHIGRGTIVTITALMYYFGILRPWHLYIFTFINSTFETFSAPASIAMLPLLIKEDMYMAAKSFSTSATSFVELVGLACAGGIIGLFGVSGAILVDGFTFFAAAIIIFFIRISGDKRIQGDLTPTVYIDNLKEGLGYVKKNKMIFFTIVLAAFVNFCLTPITVLQSPYVKDVLKTGPGGLSIFGTALTVGIMLGGLFIGQFGGKFKNWMLIFIGFLFIGINFALLSLPAYISFDYIKPIALSSIAAGMMGFFVPFVNSPISVYVLTNTPKELLGRIGSLMNMITMCALPLGSFITGIAAEYLSIGIIFLVMGSVIALVSLTLLFNKDIKNA